ncbi:MAG: 2-oxo acid dehydrogenase subunit E2 [Candidatus Hydrogenedentes bacterium]|nr:2-oxo acid dehydrogenase subunit E2 [Candidatus Hydrogenedentota bacterium]
MPSHDIRIPQLGEGLVEVRIVRLLKRPGDGIRRDEPIYTMETDKAEVDIESPADGVLESWAVAEDDIVPIGNVVARITVTSSGDVPGLDEHSSADAIRPGVSVTSHGAQHHIPRNADVSPRTRAYAKQRGVPSEAIKEIPIASDKLTPADIDRYLERRAAPSASAARNGECEEIPMSARQRTLFYRLSNASAQVVPGTIEAPVSWEPVERVHAWFKSRGLPAVETPSAFLLVAWCLALAAARHEVFRSTIVDVNTLRRYKHVNLGIAVALPNDELTSAVVERADALTFAEFLKVARARIQDAREGMDQASRVVAHVSLTGMAAFGLRTAVPVVVPPSVATLFVGAPYEIVERSSGDGVRFARVAHLALTIDHRIINGAGAAHFLNAVRERIVGLPDEFKVPPAEDRPAR